jgi:hypothetical protein
VKSRRHFGCTPRGRPDVFDIVRGQPGPGQLGPNKWTEDGPSGGKGLVAVAAREDPDIGACALNLRMFLIDRLDVVIVCSLSSGRGERLYLAPSIECCGSRHWRGYRFGFESCKPVYICCRCTTSMARQFMICEAKSAMSSDSFLTE